MTISRSEDLLVGLITLGLVPWIGWTIRRGLRRGMLPIGRTYVRSDERPGAFRVLLAFYSVCGLLMVIIALDLLFGINVRIWL